MAKSYRGGIPFKRNYAPPEEAVNFIPERIFLSLGNGAECTISEGDTVKKYGKLVGATENSPAVFSGIGGRVERVYRIGSRVDITVHSEREYEAEKPFDVPEKNINDLSEGELSSLLLERGISPLKKGKRDPRCLTVDCGASPCNDSRLYLCRTYADKIVLGAKIIMKLIGARSCTFAIPSSDLDAAEKIYGVIPKKSEMFKIVLTKDKLPASIPNLTVAALYGVEVNAARDITDSGYPVVSPLICLAYYNALVEGIPFCTGYLTVAELGGEIDVFSVPFGASLREIASPKNGERVIYARKLFGTEISSDVMTERSEAIAIAPIEPIKERVALDCIGCGRCADVCPACLSPYDIFTAVKDGENGQGLILYAAGCFECRACSYVCPSEIPLAETVIKLRHDCGLISFDVDGEDPDFYEEENENEQ